MNRIAVEQLLFLGGKMHDEEPEKPNVKIDYYDLKDAAADVSYAFGAKDKAIAGAKLFGKVLFNTALFAGRTAIEESKKISEQKEKHAEADNEKLERLKDSGSLHERVAASSILKERNQDK